MSVSSKAASEASQKGLAGERKRAYVGGAINRARHEQAQGKADHREAVADARSQIRYHEAQIAGLREGLKLRRELAGGSKKRSPTAKQLEERIRTTDLKPIGHVEDREINLAQNPDPVFLRKVYGQQQLSKALDLFPTTSLRASAKERGLSAGGSREALIGRLAAPPTREQQIAAAGGYVPKTPADKLRKLPVREMTDSQLMRDWENHPPERRRGVLEREMARRQARAEKAQQPKPAKPSAKPAARAQGATKVVREPAPPAGSRKPMASVRSYTYHGKPGFLITGRSGFNHRYSIFSESREEAERMRDDIKAGREPQFDAFRK